MSRSGERMRRGLWAYIELDFGVEGAKSKKQTEAQENLTADVLGIHFVASGVGWVDPDCGTK